MTHHPTTAVLITCPTCGLVRIADDYDSARARGKAHTSLSGHPKVGYSQIVAPDTIKVAQLEARASMESMAAQAGIKNISVEAGMEPEIAIRR